MTTSEAIKYGLLAELSYLNFRDISLSSNNQSGWEDNADYDINIGLGGNSPRIDELTSLLDTHEIVDFKSTAWGMQAILLKDSGGNYTISYRGTEGGIDYDTYISDNGDLIVNNYLYVKIMEVAG